MRERRWLSRLFLRFFLAMIAMSAPVPSRLLQYNTAQRITNNSRDPGYLIHSSMKNNHKSESQLREEGGRSTSGDQPLHLTRRKSTNRDHQRSNDAYLQLAADYIRNKRLMIEKTLPVVVKHRRAIFRVKYAGNDGQLLQTPIDNSGCSVSSDVPSKPHNVPSRPPPGFNPTGW